MTTPYERLGVLARQEIEVAPGLRHLELFTLSGLLTVLWHGEPGAEAAVVAGGGAMGGLLGPADGLYHDLGVSLAAEGVATLRVGWRRPGDLASCVLDAAAAAQLVGREGAERFVAVGHSFGGAVAVQLGVALADLVVGVVTLATQSAGCETADRLGGRPLLLVHGDADPILPVACSETVQALAGGGELVVLPGAGHLLTEAGGELRQLVSAWTLRVLRVRGA